MTVFAKAGSLWEITIRREKIGNYKRIKNRITPLHLPHLDQEIYITEDDKAILKNFSMRKSQTLSDLLTINRLEGSSIISSLEKLVNFGLVKRDWEKEEEIHAEAIYSLTHEGECIAQKKIQS